MDERIWQRRRFLGAGLGVVAGAAGLAGATGCDSGTSGTPAPLRGVPEREPLWRTTLSGIITCTEGQRERIFVGCPGTGVMLLDRATGQRLRQAPAFGYLLAAAPGSVYSVGSASRSGQVGVRSVDTTTLAERWAVELPGTENAYDVVAVADADTVYVKIPTSESPYPVDPLDEDRPFPAPLFAVDAFDGRIRWTARTMGPLSTAATGGLVCFIDDSRTLAAVDRSTGERRWTAPLFAPGANPPSQSLRRHAFRAVGGTVYVAGPGDGLLRALDGATGRLNWTLTVPPTAPLFAGDPAATRPPNRSTGARPTGALPTEYSAPTVVGDTVYLSVGYALHAVNASTGTARWSAPTTGPHVARPVVAGDSVATTVGYYWAYGDDGGVDQDGDVYAFDAATGRPRWTFHVGTVDTELFAVPGGIAVSWAGGWCVLDAVTGRPLWRVPTFEEKSRLSTTISGGFAYLHGDHDIAAVPL